MNKLAMNHFILDWQKRINEGFVKQALVEYDHIFYYDRPVLKDYVEDYLNAAWWILTHRN